MKCGGCLHDLNEQQEQQINRWHQKGVRPENELICSNCNAILMLMDSAKGFKMAKKAVLAENMKKVARNR